MVKTLVKENQVDREVDNSLLYKGEFKTKQLTLEEYFDFINEVCMGSIDDEGVSWSLYNIALKTTFVKTYFKLEDEVINDINKLFSISTNLDLEDIRIKETIAYNQFLDMKSAIEKILKKYQENYDQENSAINKFFDSLSEIADGLMDSIKDLKVDEIANMLNTYNSTIKKARNTLGDIDIEDEVEDITPIKKNKKVS